MDCIFCKIANKEIPKEFVLEKEDVMVFPDIHPVAPLHLLVVPKRHISEFAAIGNDEQKVWDRIMTIVHELIKKYGLTKKGYRVVINGGGAQLVNHLHIHLMGEITNERKL